MPSDNYAAPMSRDEFWRIFDSYDAAGDNVAAQARRELHQQFCAQWVSRALVEKLRQNVALMAMLRASDDWAFNDCGHDLAWWDRKALCMPSKDQSTRLCSFKEACRIAVKGDQFIVPEVKAYEG